MIRDFTGLSATILVVDDEVDMLELLQDGLRPYFSTVLTCADPSIALKKIADENISLLLTDYRMPKMNGRDLMIEVKKIKPMLPVLFVTGNGADSEVIKVLDIGAADIIEKPFRMPIVINRIRTSLIQPLLLDVLWSAMSHELVEANLQKFLALPVEQQVRQLYAFSALVKTRGLKKSA
jgi:DNA-binding response OmpR family regulator